MLRAFYKSSSHKSRFLQSLLLLPSYIFHAPRHLNVLSHHRNDVTGFERLREQLRVSPVVLPCATNAHLRPQMHPFLNGEGSWNVSWDARPARWLHRPDSAWFLPSLSFDYDSVVSLDGNCVASDDNGIGKDESATASSDSDNSTVRYKVTGVLADGRCLFRAIARGVCLRAGEEAPDETRETRLADELRAQVVNELLKRRAESEWFIEGDFDAYVKSIEQPHVWGGEPELLMASYVLQTPISVFMMESKSQNLIVIAKYGEEYQKNGDAVNVLFHGYGHYELVEIL